MKKIIGFCLLITLSAPAKPCDVCGCASGAATLFSNSVQYRAVGVSWNHTVFQSTHLPSLLKENAGKELKSRESFDMAAAFLRWNLGKKGAVFVFLPYQVITKQADSVNTRITGMGDAFFTLSYRVLEKEKRWRQELYLGGGLKIPTGMFSEDRINESVSRYMLPGTGSWDAIFQGIYRTRRKNWNLNAVSTYTLTGKNKAAISWGDRWQNSLEAVYLYKKGKNTSFLPRVGYLAEWAGADKQKNITLPFSGYLLHQVVAGLDFQYKQLGAGLQVFVPVAGEVAEGRVQIQQKMMFKLFYIPK